jgi:hypothetical protein
LLLDAEARLPTVTRLFDSGGQLLGVFTDADVAYFGRTPVASFETRLGYDAMSSLSFERFSPAVPEPTSLVLMLGGVGLLLARRSRAGLTPLSLDGRCPRSARLALRSRFSASSLALRFREHQPGLRSARRSPATSCTGRPPARKS